MSELSVYNQGGNASATLQALLAAGSLGGGYAGGGYQQALGQKQGLQQSHADYWQQRMHQHTEMLFTQYPPVSRPIADEITWLRKRIADISWTGASK